MQVTCPNCGARYAVDPLAIGPVGRLVQCARCANRWLQTVAAATAESAARDGGDTTSASPATAPQTPEPPPPDFAAMMSSGTSASSPSLGAAKPPELADPVPDLVIRPPRQRSSLPAVIEPGPAKPLPVKLVLAIVVLVIVVAVAVGIYLFRDDIIARLPTAWRTMLHLGS